jgi:hypothetical protein
VNLAGRLYPVRSIAETRVEQLSGTDSMAIGIK